MALADAAAPAPALQVEVVYCASPGLDDRVPLELAAGATLLDALHASGLLLRHGLPLDRLQAGVWCGQRALQTPLRDRDRVEIYRPLTVDPKEARRLRQQRDQRSR